MWVVRGEVGGQGHFTTLDGHTIVYSGRLTQGMSGVAVWIHRKIAGAFVGYEPISDRVDRLDRVSCRYSLLIDIDKTKVMASDGIACRILIQNEQLAQVNKFPYLGSLITEDGECTTEFHTRLNRGQAIGASLQKIWKSHSIPISTKIRLMC